MKLLDFLSDFGLTSLFSLLLVMFKHKRRTEGKKIRIFYLHFRPCTIMFSTFFLAYPSFFHLKKFFYSDFGPSALRLRMKESAVIFAKIWFIKRVDKG